MQIKRYSSGTNGIAKHPQPDVRQFAGCLYFWSQMREIVQIINEGEDYLGWIKSKNYNFIFQWIRHSKREEEEESHDCLSLSPTPPVPRVTGGCMGSLIVTICQNLTTIHQNQQFFSLHLNICWRQRVFRLQILNIYVRTYLNRSLFTKAQFCICILYNIYV